MSSREFGNFPTDRVSQKRENDWFRFSTQRIDWGRMPGRRVSVAKLGGTSAFAPVLYGDNVCMDINFPGVSKATSSRDRRSHVYLANIGDHIYR